MHTHCPHNQKGFTLVELLVSITIFSVITTLAVFNNAQFNASVLLTNLTYEIALSVRQAQVYGVAVRKNTADAFDSAYGVHFDLSNARSYILFEDTGSDHVYTPISDPTIEEFGIQKGNTISGICVYSGETPTCTATSNTTLDISFKRPNPNAYIRLNEEGTVYSKVDICVSSPQGTKRKITVEENGQIAVTMTGLDVCTI